MPLSTEFFSNGIFKDDGGRDIEAAEIWGFLLHVPDAGVARRIFYTQ